jgi:ribosome-associated protein
LPSPESYKLLLAAAAACEDKKAEDIRILALDPSESGLTDHFLICNGTNDRQNIAITDEVELRLKREFGIYPNSVEGRRQAEWILMDYVDFIVHVFSAEKRAFYGLERLRKSATTISIADLNTELKSAIAATRAKISQKVSAKKSAPRPAAKKPSKAAGNSEEVRVRHGKAGRDKETRKTQSLRHTHQPAHAQDERPRSR